MATPPIPSPTVRPDRSNRILGYYRRSLLDAQRLGPSPDLVAQVLDGDHIRPPSSDRDNARRQDPTIFRIPLSEALNGRIDPTHAQPICQAMARAQESSQRGDPGSVPPQEANCVFIPWVGRRRSQYGAESRMLAKVCMPICVQISLSPDGELKAKQCRPFFSREWLDGSAGDNHPFGDAAQVDRFNEGRSAESMDSWKSLRASLDELCQCVAGTALSTMSHQDYERTDFALLIGDAGGGDSVGSIVSVYDAAARMKDLPRLFKTLIDDDERPADALLVRGDIFNADKQHVGQMQGEFPLAHRQREALRHYLVAKDYEITAVNGPPGTGKTTLLQSIVANAWTLSAWNKDLHPPVIVATSSNNKAVTNILDSFKKAVGEAPKTGIDGRWLPGVTSFGVYCPSNFKVQSAQSAGYPYRLVKRSDRPSVSTLDTAHACDVSALDAPEYIARATESYLTCASAWLNRKVQSVADAVDAMHAGLNTTLSKIRHIIHRQRQVWETLQGPPAYHSIADMRQAHRIAKADHAKAEQELAAQARIEDRWRSHVFQRPWWLILLGKFWFIQRWNERANATFCQEHGLVVSGRASDRLIVQTLSQLRTQIKRRVDEKAEIVSTYDRRISEYDKEFAELRKSLSEINAPNAESEADINAAIDTNLRHRAFQCACHYWEGRWLLATAELNEKKTAESAQWQAWRSAMLFPCSVSTMFTLPKRGLFDGFNTIDLLIVDEAGQSTPAVAGAAFIKSRKALVVGDVDQIEPVWEIPTDIDLPNLADAGLIDDDHPYEWWLSTGRGAARGNLMRMAQAACRFHAIPTHARGLYLTEHRRCRPRIIDYCNRLVYHGILEPKRPETSLLKLPAMALVHVSGVSSSEGGSRYNDLEAQQVAAWIRTHADMLIAAYAPKFAGKKTPRLHDLVAVVTPFKAQAKRIAGYLNQQSCGQLTIGTVHSLQGAEIPVVIFSAVYGAPDARMGKFYDRGHNMLNVAVSRAIDHFIVMADRHAFGNQKGTPSHLLREYLEDIIE